MHLRKILPIILAAACAFLSLSIWAFASPPGSGPDDDFHLPAIWCSHGKVQNLCDPEFSDDGFGKTPTPLSPSAICFAFKSDESAACQQKLFNWNNNELSGSRTNEIGRFPNGFYWSMHLLIGQSTLFSAMAMRILNAFLAVAILFTTIIFSSPRVRTALIGSWIATIIPLGFYTISSTNPSSWTVIGIGIYWAALISYLNEVKKYPLLITGFITLLTGIMAIESRSEASPYLIISTISVFILNNNLKDLFKLNSKMIIPISLITFAAYEFLTTPSTLGWSSGLPGGDQNRPTIAIWFYNISEWPTFISGSIGGWPLGWLDVPMPSITYFFSMLTFSGILIVGLIQLNFRKFLALSLVLSALIIFPLRILALGKNFVGENVQPRYFLPLLILFVGIALYSLKSSERISLSNSQILITAFAISISHSFALHFVLRRFITGTDVIDWNLNKNIEWWWSFMPPPMTSWAMGSLGFAIAVSVGLWQLRKPIKSDY